MILQMVDYMLRSVENLALLQNAGEAHKASALHLAARNGHTHIVCRLLEHGWDVNRTTALGSALHEAAGYGRAQVVRFLLHAGINASLTNAAGLTALEYAKKNAHRNPITIKEIRFLLKGNVHWFSQQRGPAFFLSSGICERDAKKNIPTTSWRYPGFTSILLTLLSPFTGKIS
ncbi:ankyrin repeat protein [Ancylostoma duodenale]|uniref:Ankyrin repeat protein n=1 Tax=Ancylostoma duodenale TaxID=51022 RepID=A0A0C2H188_9BILA|nr:ankyrin repeat protein [Ancylostoma duodenale]